MALFATDDDLKLYLVYNFVHENIGQHISPYQTPGTSATTLVLVALERIMDVTSAADLSRLLNWRIALASNSVFVHRYMDKASGRLHDALLSKTSNAFFGGLGADNPFSSNSLAPSSRRQDYARQDKERHD